MGILRSATQWALDTNVLIHLVEGKENVCAACEIACERGIRLFATEVVFSELMDIAENGETARVQRLAAQALHQSRRKWSIEPLGITDLERTIAESFAEALLQRKVIPQCERNDAIVLAEAAVKDIPFVISSDSHLINADREELVLLCHAKDLRVVSVLHPTAALRSLGG
jgi:predicted nucleic acid-binding protein